MRPRRTSPPTPLAFPLWSRVVVGAALLVAACGDDDPTETPVGPDAGIDASTDTAGPPEDTGPDTSDTSPDAPDDDVLGDEDADAGEPDATIPDLDWCDGPTRHLWDPIASTEIEFYPDGTLLSPDSTSPTGWRVDITEETAPWLEGIPPILNASVRNFPDLSGYGTLGGALFRFDAPVQDVPRTWEESVESDAWIWLDIEADPPTRIPFEARVLEDGLAVVLWPLTPQRLGTEHLLVLTRAATADDGGCIAPSEATRSLLHGEPLNERLASHAPAWQDALARAGIEPADVSAMTVYTTHDDLGPVREASRRVHEAEVDWVRPGTHGDCIERGETLQCEARTTVLDFRDERGLVDGTATPVEAEIPVTYWLPAEGEGPFPAIIYGHGLNSEREEGWEIASRLTPQGFVVLSMEAVEHGEHPSVDPEAAGSTDIPALRFLGIDLGGLQINSRAIRGNFNQTNIDRLRLIRLVREHPDFDGDGIPEIDPERVAYVGASLGAICGSGLLALSPDIDAAALLIGGARLISIVTDTELLGQYRALIDRLVRSPTAFDRLMPLAQHLVDPADSGVWAPHVLHDRFDGRTPPSLVVPVGMFDEVVPPAAGRALARALDVPHLGPVVETVEIIDVIEEGPVQGNFADGERTVAYFQLDRVQRDGRVRAAEHVDTAKSDEAAWMLRVFFSDWAAGDAPTIADPYAALETPPLPDPED